MDNQLFALVYYHFLSKGCTAVCSRLVHLLGIILVTKLQLSIIIDKRTGIPHASVALMALALRHMIASHIGMLEFLQQLSCICRFGNKDNTAVTL